jgi:GntR family transcriptional regulator, rspAB operon transcriptional repressor
MAALTAKTNARKANGMPAGANTNGSPPQVFEVLRDRIISLTLAPGTILHRNELQDEFALSSTPIRDALMRLADEGLVEIKPQSATRVSLIDVTLARQAQFLRRAVEQEAVRILAERADKGFVAVLERNIAEQKRHADAGEIDAFYAADWALHRLLYELAGAPDLWSLVRQRSGHIDRIRRLHLPAAGKMQQIVADHEKFIRAIAAGDAAAAQTHMRDHLSRSLSLSQELQDQNPTYFQR